MPRPGPASRPHPPRGNGGGGKNGPMHKPTRSRLLASPRQNATALRHAPQRKLLYALAAGLLCGAAWLAAPSAQAAQPAVLAAVAARATLPLAEVVSRIEKSAPGRVVQIELEDERNDAQGAPLYEVELATAQGQREDLMVSSASGQPVSRKADGPLKAKDADRLKAATLPMVKAVEAALGQQAGRAVKAELDTHFGTVVYEVEILTAQNTLAEVKVNAASGQIVNMRGK